MLQASSDIEEIEQIAPLKNVRVHGRFGWGISPNIERAKVAREPRPPVLVKKEPDEPAPPAYSVFTDTDVVSYSELMAAIRDKLAVLKIKYEDFDELAGLAKGMTGKALGPAQAKRFGLHKVFDALRAAGLRLRVENDPLQHDAMSERIAKMFNQRQANQARPNNGNHVRPSEVLICRVLNYLLNENSGNRLRRGKAAKKPRSRSAKQSKRKG